MTGRPTKYSEEVCDQARKLCKTFGATNEQLAEYFSVNVDTIYEWQKVHTCFSEALKQGKSFSDDRVERALYERAIGYSHAEDKVFNANGEPLIVPTEKHYPPDVAAAIIWLGNRRPEKWKKDPSGSHHGQSLADALGKIADKLPD